MWPALTTPEPIFCVHDERFRNPSQNSAASYYNRLGGGREGRQQCASSACLPSYVCSTGFSLFISPGVTRVCLSTAGRQELDLPIYLFLPGLSAVDHPKHRFINTAVHPRINSSSFVVKTSRPGINFCQENHSSS